MDPFGLSECMAYVFTFQGLVSDHRFNIQSVPLRVFWPESKAHDHSRLGRSGKESWHLLSRLVVWFPEHVDELFDLVLRWRNWGWVSHLTSGSREGLSCSLLPPDAHSQAELWPRFLRFALQGPWAPRVPAWSPACGHRGPRLTHFLPWRSCGPCGMTLGLSP